MKIRRMLAAELPIVFRMAMSRLFSITSRISDATMFSAATMTMRPMVIEIAIFSSHSAENRLLFVSPHSCGDVLGAMALDDRVDDLLRAEHVVDAKLDVDRRLRAEQALRDVDGR